MIEFKAYCLSCKKAVDCNVKEIKYTPSGKMLYVGNCNICFYETKRIVKLDIIAP